jgi:phospholipid/cholesterol/gamma-HCH transport system ATP-binding protein
LSSRQGTAAEIPCPSEPERAWYPYGSGARDPGDDGPRSAVDFRDCHASFGDDTVLHGVNMGLPEGVLSILTGPSGAGKSLCVKLIVGLLKPDRGDVLVHGESVPGMAEAELSELRKRLGVVFSDGALFGAMSAFDNVAFPLRRHTDKSKREIESTVSRLLIKLGLLDDAARMPGQLTAEQRKRCALARALALDPDVVLIDEPAAGLDQIGTARFARLIVEVHRDTLAEAKRGDEPRSGFSVSPSSPRLPTFVVATHDVMTARRIGDYISVLCNGRIEEAGPSEHVLVSSESPFVSQFLGGHTVGPVAME